MSGARGRERTMGVGGAEGGEVGGVLVKLRQQWGMGRRWALGKGRGGEMTAGSR